MARADELDRLKRFSEVLLASMHATDKSTAFTAGELAKAISGCATLKGARSIVRDMLEWTQDVHGQALADLDLRLSYAGLPTLSLMRSKEDAELGGILARGSIASEDEYLLVNTRLIDTASNLTDADRALAERLLAAFKA